jgi:hypothetical protein
LVIKGDGHFTQTVKVKATGKVAVGDGTWSFDPKDHYIGLQHMMVVEDDSGKLARNFDREWDGVVFLPLERWSGRLQIGGEPAIPYYKQANHPQE